MNTLGASGMMFQCVLEGSISMHDTVIERRPYHKNCNCALHKSKGGVCSNTCSQQRTISFPKKQSWTDGSLSMAAATSKLCLQHSLPGNSSTFTCVFEGSLSIQDTEIERRPYHKNCNCALHKSKGGPCSNACAQRNISFPKKQSWTDSSLCMSAATSKLSSQHCLPGNTSILSMKDTEIERRPYHKNCNCALHKSKGVVCHNACQQRNVSFPKKQLWTDGSLCMSTATSKFSSYQQSLPGNTSMSRTGNRESMTETHSSTHR
ncbi:hypothetical protein ACLB2K_009103 [Fragaria x ananassa]